MVAVSLVRQRTRGLGKIMILLKSVPVADSDWVFNHCK